MLAIQHINEIKDLVFAFDPPKGFPISNLYWTENTFGFPTLMWYDTKMNKPRIIQDIVSHLCGEIEAKAILNNKIITYKCHYEENLLSDESFA